MLSFDNEGLRTKGEVPRSGPHSILAHVTAGTGVNLSTTQGPLGLLRSSPRLAGRGVTRHSGTTRAMTDRISVHRHARPRSWLQPPVFDRLSFASRPRRAEIGTDLLQTWPATSHFGTGYETLGNITYPSVNFVALQTQSGEVQTRPGPNTP